MFAFFFKLDLSFNYLLNEDCLRKFLAHKVKRYASLCAVFCNFFSFFFQFLFFFLRKRVSPFNSTNSIFWLKEKKVKGGVRRQHMKGEVCMVCE